MENGTQTNATYHLLECRRLGSPASYLILPRVKLSVTFTDGFRIRRFNFKAPFRNDPSETKLVQWYIYEEENPDTFTGMYQFWIQKKSQFAILLKRIPSVWQGKLKLKLIKAALPLTQYWLKETCIKTLQDVMYRVLLLKLLACVCRLRALARHIK